jgi:hypothetical protein
MTEAISEIIANTVFMYDGMETIIEIYLPKIAFPDSDEFMCEFSIRGGINHKNRIIGYDSMQSLVLCLNLIGDFLKNSDLFDKNLFNCPGGELDFIRFA